MTAWSWGCISVVACSLSGSLPWIRGGLAVRCSILRLALFSLATFAPDNSAWLWPNARRDRNRFSSLPNNSRHRQAIRSTRSSINSLMRIALTHRYRRTPHANIVTTRVRGMMRASVRRCDLFNLFRQCDYSRTPCGLASRATGLFPTSNQNSTRPQHQSNATATFGATRHR